MGERSHAEADTAAPAAIATAIDLGPDALPIELRDQSSHGERRRRDRRQAWEIGSEFSTTGELKRSGPKWF
jgi:hypothetical protein